MKQKLAIFLDTDRLSGGAYHELVYMIDKIEKMNNNELEIIIIYTSKNLEINFKNKNFKTYYISMNFFQRHIAFLRNYDPTIRRLKKYIFFKNKLEDFLKKIDVDLVYFTGPSQYSLYLEKTDFIITIPDVSHREDLEFPEWTKTETSEFHRREEIISKSSIKAIAIITNAGILKDKISNLYKAAKDRIYVINHRPSLAISNFDKYDQNLSNKVKKIHKLPDKYIFYPAMYLPHKNHKYIIDVIKIIDSNKNFNLSAVFCGSDKGYLEKIKKYSSDNKINDKILFLDYVEDEHLPYLYLNSKALVMPTFSGPTNIPPWEAFKMEIPVFYSKLENIEKVYKNAVYYINPYDPNSLVNGLKEVLNQKEQINKLTNFGKDLLNSIDAEQEFNQLFQILRKRKKIRSSWRFD